MVAKKEDRTSNTKSPKLVTVLLCENVRKEITGQDIIIGVFDENINVPQFPISFNVSVYSRFRFFKSESVNLGLKISQQGRLILPQMQFPLQSPVVGSLVTIVIGPMSLTIQSVGELVFEYTTNGSEWEELARASIQFMSAHMSTAPTTE